MRNYAVYPFAVVLAAQVWGGSGAWAQTVDNNRATDQQQREQESIRKSQEAAGQSKLLDETAGPDVTYQQVLKDPDNVALNAAYARTQIRHGDLLGASKTLERLLLIHPDAADVALLYGVVLFRLDDVSTAKKVLEGIEPATLSASQKVERDGVIAQIDKRAKRVHQTVSVAFGTQFDTDKNAVPNGRNVLINDVPFLVDGSAKPRKDYGNLGSVSYDIDYDLDTDPRSSIYTTLNYFIDQQSTVRNFSTNSRGAEVGYRLQDGPWRLQTGAFWNSQSLMYQYLLSDYGVSVKPMRRLNAEWDVFGDFRYEQQVFHNVTADPTGTDNSGDTSTEWLGATWHATPEQSISLSGGYARHFAQQSYMAYQRQTARLNDTLLFGYGQFVVLASEFGNSVYDTPQTSISALDRHDKDMRVGITYGVPFGGVADVLGGEAPDLIKDLVMSVRGELYRSYSSVLNYSYHNAHAEMLLSKRMEF